MTMDMGDRFDWAFTIILLWFTSGAVADAYNHNQGAPVTFYTPEHGIAYTAVTAFTAMLAFILYRGWRTEGSILGAIPDGYRLTLLSIPLFALGGFGDMFWHQIFGFEVRSPQMLSPTHLLLGLGAIFLITGPLRRAWHRGVTGTWRDQFPLLTSAGLLMALATFMTQHFNPYVWPVSAAGMGLTSEQWGLLGIAGIMLHTIIMMAVLLRVMDRFDLVRGGILYIFVIQAVILTAVNGQYVFFASIIATGVIAELICRRFDPTAERPLVFRAFAFAVPALQFALYFLTVHVSTGLVWTIHTWSGSIVLAACVGTLVSYVILPTAGDTPQA